MDIQGIGTLLLGCVGVYNAIQSTLAKRAARRASAHASDANDAIHSVGDNVKTMDDNMNGHLTALIEAKESVANLTGERRGFDAGAAQEVARQNKENT